MFLDILELGVQNSNDILDKTVFILQSQILKIWLKSGLRNGSKNIAKKYQNMKLSTIFGGFRGLNDSSHLISEATFR